MAGTTAKIPGIILAAGTGSRMGRTKQLLDCNGRPLLAHAVEKALAAGLSPLILVLGHRAETIKAKLAGYPVDMVFNPDFRLGMATSIRAGIQRLEHQSESAVPGALFLLGDQPSVSVSSLKAISTVAENQPGRIIIPHYQGTPGNPVYFGRCFFAALKQLSGDRGGRVLFKQYAHAVEKIDLDDPGICLDIDTPRDFETLARHATLIDSLNPGLPAAVCLVGGGGKTSFMFTLAREAAVRGHSVLITTTTAMFTLAHMSHLIDFPAPDRMILGPADQLTVQPAAKGSVTLAARALKPGGKKLAGYNLDQADAIVRSRAFDLVLIEGDGAKMLPLKAPAEHEPQIPAQCTMVAGVIGLDSLGAPLDASWVHRPEHLAALAGQTMGSPVTPDTIMHLAASDHGLFKSAPAGARKVLVLNKADTLEQTALGHDIARQILERGLAPQCLVTSFKDPAGPVRI